MQLSHLALWTNQLETLREFYIHYFNAQSNEKYINPRKGFASYFLSFENGVSLEIMERTDITKRSDRKQTIGLTHFAFLVSSPEKVNKLTELFRKDNFPVTGEPRLTGDGFYEAVIEDPDGNQIEIVAYPEIIIQQTKDYPYDLLLLADPDRKIVDNYLSASDCFVAIQNGVEAGVIVVQEQENKVAEIMNLAVSEHYQRRGIARHMMRYISEKWAPQHNISKLNICTGTSAPGPLMLYQQEGFDIVEIDYNYFVRTYPEPIWENGVQCKHRLIMEKEIKSSHPS